MRHYIADNGAWTRLYITVTTKQQTQEQECLRHADTHSIIWAVTGCNQRSSLDAMPAQKTIVSHLSTWFSLLKTAFKTID